jgi:hypothetical protein
MSPSFNLLQDGVERSAATTLILDFDRSWWTIRQKLDAYLEAAETHNQAFTDAMTVLDDYTTKCAADFASLKHAQMKLIQVDKATGTQLLDTYHAVESELGLLAARIADSDGFVHLARLDAEKADFVTNHSAICSQGGVSKEAALVALQQAVKQGYFGQTWQQLRDVFEEMDMLQGRFSSMGLRTPSNETLIQAADRVSSAISVAERYGGDIAIEAAHRACGQEAASSHMPATSDSKLIGELEATITTIREAEAAKDRATKQNLQAEVEKERAVEQNLELEKKLHAMEVHDLEEKLRSLQGQATATN